METESLNLGSKKKSPLWAVEQNNGTGVCLLPNAEAFMVLGEFQLGKKRFYHY